MNVYFTEDEFYGSEAEQRIHVSVGKSRRIATPLLLVIVPLSIDDIEPDLNFNLTTQEACPEKCSCECQVAPYGNETKQVISRLLWEVLVVILMPVCKPTMLQTP